MVAPMDSSNIHFCQSLIQIAIQQGVKTFCVCAGARNAPIVALLDQIEGFEVLPFFEERSASFFALGRARRDSRPVCVVTTSGTAAAELLPAAIEAYYSKIPLILMTADRPKSYRQSGAPQSIEQKSLFGVYANDWDLEVNSDLSSLSLPIENQVYHWNVCLDEPLLDKAVNKWHPSIVTTAPKGIIASSSFVLKKLDRNFSRPLVIVSNLDVQQAERLSEVLLELNLPIYAEANSNLHHYDKIKPLLLKGSDRSVSQLFKLDLVDSVIRIGGVPTLRLWRDLESRLNHVPVMSIAKGGLSGLSRSSVTVVDFFEWLNSDSIKIEFSSRPSVDWQAIHQVDQEMSAKLQKALITYPMSEANLVMMAFKNFKGSNFYVGNSLPVRHLDLIVGQVSGSTAQIFSNRGANGIDGQISTFLGWVQEGQENLCLVGDLTALYDLSALAVSKNYIDKLVLTGTKIRIGILNNRGGQIFRPMFKSSLFVNSHDWNFSSWAKMFSWNYSLISDLSQISRLNSSDSPLEVIEIIPDQEQSDSFNGWFS